MEYQHRYEKPSKQSTTSVKENHWPFPGASATDLIKTHYRILIDAELFNTPGFRIFYQEWVGNTLYTERKLLFMSALDCANTHNLAAFSGVKVLRYTDCEDYVTFFRIIKKMGTWLYLTTNKSNTDTIFNACRDSKIYLRIYTLDDNGKLRNCKVTSKKSNTDVNIISQNVDAFGVSTQIAPIRKVIRRSHSIPSTGDTVYTSDGKAFQLGEEFISNPQSITYQTNYANFQGKIYQPEWLNISYYEDKANRMLEKPMRCKGICWPLDILRNADGEFVGLLLPAAQGHQLKQQLMSQQGLEKHFPTWNRSNLTHLTRVILEKIEYLQERNVIFGLVNPSSIFVQDEDHVYFVDMDAYQIEGYPILSFERVLQAPELQDIPSSMRLYTQQEDNYGVALLTFMLLMPGKFPYNKGRNKDISTSIKNMSFAFRYGRNGEEHGTKEYFGSWRFVWSHLGNDLKQAFHNTFQRDQLYSLPEKRRNAKFWRIKVSDLERELNNPYDQESLRIFPRTFKRYSGTQTIRCIKCGINHPNFYYRFPNKEICNSCLGKPSTTYFECKSCNKSFYYDFATLFKYEELVTKKSFAMPTHCPYCRSDKRKCNHCGKTVPVYRLNNDGVCIDCRNKVVTTYYCKCGNTISLTQGQYDFHMKKFGRLPQRCDRCKADRQRRY